MSSDLALKAKQERILAVRKQEALIARQSSKSFRQGKDFESKISNIEKIKEEKEAEIRKLMNQKEYCLSNLGKAQILAEEEQRIAEEEIRAKEIFIREAKIKAQERAEIALRVHQENKEKKEIEENYLKEKRAEVLKKENENAHFLAAKFREKQKELEEIQKEEELKNFVRPGGVVMYGQIDYSKTHFHNTIILKHDISEKNAKEIAAEEQEKALLKLQEKEENKIVSQQIAEKRGNEALMQVYINKNLAKLNKELEKIRCADGFNKIEKGIKDPVSQNRCLTKDRENFNKKQEKLENEFEKILYFSNIEAKNEPKNNSRVWEVNDDKNNVFDIPQPKSEETIQDNLKISEEDEKITKSIPKVSFEPKSFKIPSKVVVENNLEKNDSQDEELEISESEESSDPEVLSAKYENKQAKNKRHAKKKKGSSQKKTKKFQKYLEKNDEVPETKGLNFNIEESKEFKGELDKEYSKHMEIKQELENLKKFKTESEKSGKVSKGNKNRDPPSIISSQISPAATFQKKNYEEFEKNFEKTSSFPEPAEKSDDIFDIYNKFKDGLGSRKKDSQKSSDSNSKGLEKREKSFESDEKFTSNSNKFLEEMKIRYGIIPKEEIKLEEIENSSFQSENIQSLSQSSNYKEKNSEKLVPDNILTERTLKLMKEIEEKYTLDKFKVTEDDDLRFAMPLSKPNEKWNEEKLDVKSKKFQLDNYIDEEDEEQELPAKYLGDIKNIKNPQYEKARSEEEYEENSGEFEASNEDELGNNEDFEVSDNSDEEKLVSPQKHVEKKNLSQHLGSLELKENEKKPLYDKDFFNEIKNKYGFTSASKSEKEKEFDYKFDFEKESQNESNSYEKSISYEKSNESNAFNEEYQIKNQKKSGISLDFNEGQGKSLAEIFKEKNRKIAEKINQREANIPKVNHKEKTKEELLEIRKDFMKGKGEKSSADKKTEENNENSIKKINNPVLERLGKGEKPKISKKEMHDLTKKNYELLPEVQRKKEEERKKQEIKERIKKSKEFDKVIHIQKRQEQKSKN